jgi:hypothetical protein
MKGITACLFKILMVTLIFIVTLGYYINCSLLFGERYSKDFLLVIPVINSFTAKVKMPKWGGCQYLSKPISAILSGISPMWLADLLSWRWHGLRLKFHLLPAFQSLRSIQWTFGEFKVFSNLHQTKDSEK